MKIGKQLFENVLNLLRNYKERSTEILQLQTKYQEFFDLLEKEAFNERINSAERIKYNPKEVFPINNYDKWLASFEELNNLNLI